VGVAVAQISQDIKLEISQIVWIITSYSLCFSAFLLFAGRLADIFRAQFIFIIGFVGLGVLSLVNSFVTSNKYGFLILRGLGGIFGALTIPAS
jgi:MFS family permease